MASTEDTQASSEAWNLKIWVGTAVGLFAATLVVAFLAATYIPNAFQGFGEFGDFVGGLANPMLALIGVLALLYTIRLQLSELTLSRNELELTRQELSKSAQALEKQVIHLEKQQISQDFFDLFQMYKSVVSEMSYGGGETRLTGKAAFEKHVLRFSPSPYSESGWSVDQVKEAHENLNNILGNYFRIIYRLLSYLQDQGEDAEFFADIFRAQLTTSELYLLFFNCISTVGKPMQKYANKFELFDNMPIPPREGFGRIAKLVDQTSFGKNSKLLELVAG